MGFGVTCEIERKYYSITFTHSYDGIYFSSLKLHMKKSRERVECGLGVVVTYTVQVEFKNDQTCEVAFIVSWQ